MNALRDLRAFFATRQPHQFVFAAISIALPILIIAGFVHDSRVDPPPPQMYFIPSWPADRSDADIIAQQKIDEAEKQKALAAKQADYKRLADRFGIK